MLRGSHAGAGEGEVGGLAQCWGKGDGSQVPSRAGPCREAEPKRSGEVLRASTLDTQVSGGQEMGKSEARRLLVTVILVNRGQSLETGMKSQGQTHITGADHLDGSTA